jgi:D-aminopeptidase
VQTGVTVIAPHGGNLFTHKLPAAAASSTASARAPGWCRWKNWACWSRRSRCPTPSPWARCSTPRSRHTLRANPECGRSLPTVNPLVLECNDGYLNDLQALAVQPAHYVRRCRRFI